MIKMIYADNAATTQLDLDAFEAMKPFLLEKYGNPSQPYSFSQFGKNALKDARKTIAKCINAEPEEILFTSGGTESDNWAIKCFGSNRDIKHIVTSNIEHHAVLNACKLVNASIDYLKVDNQGVVNSEDLESILLQAKERVATFETTLVSVMMANNEIGTIQPIKELARIAHEHGAIFHTDAVQAVGHIQIDVKELNVDMLSASAHKFNGPKGIGFLYVKKGTPLYQLNSGGNQEFGLRAGTENVAAIVGMAKALENNVHELERNQLKLRMMEMAFFNEMDSYGIDYKRNGFSEHLPGLINISIKGKNGETILHRLDLMGCCISTGSACDSVNNQVSHVIKAINVPDEYAEGTIRISFGKYNELTDPLDIALMIRKVVSQY